MMASAPPPRIFTSVREALGFGPEPPKPLTAEEAEAAAEAEGLTLEELAARLEETFVFLDRNKNGKLGWPELL